MHILSTALVALAAAAVPFQPHGPIGRFLDEGVKVSPAPKGLELAVALGPDGKVLSGTSTELTGSRWKSPCRVELKGAAVVGGHFKASLSFSNSSGLPLEGMRFDLSGASERFPAKGEAGKPIEKERPLRSAKLEPILLPDLQPNAALAAEPIDVAGVTLGKDATGATLRFSLSGVAWLGELDAASVTNPGQIDVDPKGNLVIVDVTGSRVVRAGPEGGPVIAEYKVPDQCVGAAADPKSGTIVATAINHDEIFFFPPSGKQKTISTHELASNLFRYGKDGTLYAAQSGIHRVKGGKIEKSWDKAGDVDLYVKGLDLDGKVLWAVSRLEDDQHLVRLDTQTGKAVDVARRGDALGGMRGPVACRVVGGDEVYVLQGGAGEQPPDVSVFDRDGRFVRAFGHAGETFNPDKVWPGQVARPVDLVAHPDGRILIAESSDGGFQVKLLQVFIPFR